MASKRPIRSSSSDKRFRRYERVPSPDKLREMRETERRILRLYKEGLSSPKIAEMVLLDSSHVAKIVRRYGLTRPGGWANEPDPTLRPRNDKIERMYRSGMTSRAIAEKLGTDKSTVLRALRLRKVARRQKGAWSTGKRAEYFRYRAYALEIAPLLGTGPGTSVSAFARAEGLREDTLMKHMRRLGIKVRLTGNTIMMNEDVARIKHALIFSRRTMRDIADDYGTTQSGVSAIAQGKVWKHIPWPKGYSYRPRPTGTRTKDRPLPKPVRDADAKRTRRAPSGTRR